MSDQSLAIHIDLDSEDAQQKLQNLQTAIVGLGLDIAVTPQTASNPPESDSPNSSASLLEELQQLKAEARLQTQHLQELLAALQPLVHFLTAD